MGGINFSKTFRPTARIKWLTVCILAVLALIFLRPIDSNDVADILVPIEFTHIPTGLIVTDPSKKGIEVRVRGHKNVLKKLPAVTYLLDLKGHKAGFHMVPLPKEQLSFPRGVSVESTDPVSLTLRLEIKMKKSVPIVLNLAGKPAKGFTIAKAGVSPSGITLQGSETALAGIDTIQTKPIDVNDAVYSFKKETTLDLPESVDIVSGPAPITAQIQIKEMIVTRHFEKIPVSAIDGRYTCAIEPPSIDIDVQGPENTIEKLFNENGIKVHVDVSGLKPGVYVRRAIIELPVNTTLVDGKPEVFTVTICRP